jgi:hypothetical protein
LIESAKSAERELAKLKAKAAASAGTDLASSAIDVKGAKVLAVTLDGADVKGLRETMDKLKDKLKSAAIVLGSVADGRVTLIAGVTNDLTARLKAGELVGTAAPRLWLLSFTGVAHYAYHRIGERKVNVKRYGKNLFFSGPGVESPASGQEFNRSSHHYSPGAAWVVMFCVATYRPLPKATGTRTAAGSASRMRATPSTTSVYPAWWRAPSVPTCAYGRSCAMVSTQSSMQTRLTSNAPSTQHASSRCCGARR